MGLIICIIFGLLCSIIINNFSTVCNYLAEELSGVLVIISFILGIVWAIGTLCGCTAIEIFLLPFGLFFLASIFVMST